MNSLERSGNVFLGRRETRLHHGVKRDPRFSALHSRNSRWVCVKTKVTGGQRTDLLAMSKMKRRSQRLDSIVRSQCHFKLFNPGSVI